MVEVSVNYYGQHRLRSRVVVKIGKPRTHEFDHELMGNEEYKKKTIQKMMDEMKVAFESTKILGHTYNDLIVIYFAKQLFMSGKLELSVEEDFDIHKLFSEIFFRTKETPEHKGMRDDISHRQQDNE